MATFRNLRKRVFRSRAVNTVLAAIAHGWLAFVFRTNRLVASSDSLEKPDDIEFPVIIALWHGQHFMVPFLRPPGMEFATMLSTSADAELNARLVERMGMHVIRGSGGRAGDGVRLEKGGAQALIDLVRCLRKGMNVATIADISKGRPRDAGEGIVRLAMASGRPVVPLAYATSRHIRFEKAWDKAVLNLPFGRACIKTGAPVFIGRKADAAEIEALRETDANALKTLLSSSSSGISVMPAVAVDTSNM